MTLISPSNNDAKTIIYMDNKSLVNNTRADLTDFNWGVSKAIITHIIINTTSTNWNLTLFSSSNESSGILGTGIQIMTSGNGNKIIPLQLPYIDNDCLNQVHLKISGANDATTRILGIKSK